MRYRFLLSICLVIAATYWIACNNQSKPKTSKAKARDEAHYSKEEYISIKLDSNAVNSFIAKHPEYVSYTDLVKDFYSKRNYHYAWITDSGMTEQAASFMNLMRTDANYIGQDSSLVNHVLQAQFDTLTTREQWRANDTLVPSTELMLTAQFFAYGNKVWGGMTADSAKDLEWYIPRKKMEIGSLLESVIDHKGKDFAGEAPVHKQYNMLRKELERISNMSKDLPQDSLILDKKVYKKGDSAAVIVAVKQRLHAWGDLAVADTSNKYTPALDSAVRRFQDRMGLKVDGQLQAATITALNVPLSKRIEQILINMERLRWVPTEQTGDYILVNIPEFKMHVYDHDSLAWSCNVVVGKPGASTVVFSREMKYIVFAPYWNVPPGILANEVLPGIKRNSGYLARHNMEVVGASGKVIAPSSISWGKYTGRNFPYIVRQKPGGANSLGKVKFLFPNEYNIYLHDTPSKGLFNETNRTFSHGCIRVAEPKRLAEYLLRNDTYWTEKRIDEAMNAGKEKYVTLKTQVPVFIGYFTTWVNSKGELNFRNDVYGHDAQLAKQLFTH
ncbi:murein L,D-transpeptidase YcbB/YkuD [Chitinophaga skermanii]|uniref:Murein L,D-transpeptidase YcbB/YkuD n=1 Tax=Chitinophaga skermanii TaxID=331697 RepID=A0A327QQ18_9BACT|nr:L,D-transpeptidase family protein [Chitinophaga skermanii]RAJ03867.1 murein L,D-transpeptidase YcbB/YkuD [Chitinophaga skermanii]